MFLPCYESVTTANQRAASSRSFPMNKIVNLQDPNALRVADPETQEPGKDGAKKRRRRGGAIFGSAALLLLIGGLALGVSRSYSQQQLVMSTAEQIRYFVPHGRGGRAG